MSVIKKYVSFIIIFLFVSTINVYSDNLNILFKELLNAKNLQQAEKLEDQIWNKWTRHPNNDYLTNKLENGTYSMYHQQYRMALKLFTDVINEDPKWAEGWNKRATLLFILGDYEKSLDDIEKLVKDKQKMLAAIPSIQPVKNNDLTRIASGYGMRTDPFDKSRKMHGGIDFAAPRNTPVYAASNGKIVRADNRSIGYGKHIRIDHGYGFVTLYAHLNSYNVKRGAADQAVLGSSSRAPLQI